MAQHQHQIYEASAGTGKTYNVTRKVLTLLTDGVPLEQILVVTFTEKAAAELLERLRHAIQAELQQTAQPALAKALEEYDKAQVFTIHAFCLGILQQFPFDHGHGSRGRLVNDDEVMHKCLREIQRRSWPEKYAACLASILAISEFEAGEKWEDRVLRLARSYRPACRHLLLPQSRIDAAEIARADQEIARVRAEVGKLAGPLVSTVMEHPLYRAFGEFELRADWRESRRTKYLAPLLLWATDSDCAESAIASFVRVAANFKDNGYDILAKGYKTKNRFVDALNAIVPKMVALSSRIPDIHHALAVETAVLLIQRMDEYKKARGQQSFDDFLTRVAAAFDEKSNPRAPLLLAAMRARYRVAIVDEFQDTDPLQWEIFRRIFVNDGGVHRLILVGDPKQAIYSFRNADLATYIEARDELQEKGADSIRLDTSFRASAELLAGLNAIFGSGAFFTADGGVSYEPVKAAPESDRPRAVRDDTARKAVTRVDFPADIAGGKLRPRMAQFVGAEIERLLNMRGAPLLRFQHRTEERDLRANDIAVLVFYRFEAELIEAELARRGIPYSFYKKTGIWQSDEAIHLHYVLNSLSRADDAPAFRAMLLTRFFGAAPSEVAALDQAGADPIHRLFSRWRELSQRRRWAELFRSILSDSQTLHEECKRFDGSRRIANLVYITQELSRAAYRQGFTLFDIVAMLREKRLTSSEDESGLHPLESERPMVQLMTIHASKGLEFPVVFLAAGFTQRKKESFLKYHDGGRLVLNLDDGPPELAMRAQRESNDENRRLLYVALTRAMLKLYVPHLPKSKDTEGPLADLLTPALDAAPAETLGTVSAPEEEKFSAPPQKPTQAPGASRTGTIRLASPLLPELDAAALAGRRLELQSFSRIAHGAVPMVHEPEIERPPREDDDDPRAHFEDDLPPGADAGEALHNILETIDFTAVKSARRFDELLKPGSETAALIERCVEKHLPLPETAGGEEIRKKRFTRAAQIVWHTLHKPLPALGGVKLCEIPASDRIHELEFHYAFHAKDLALEELSVKDGYMTGWMDLLFRYEGKCYLLDWKSNALPGYSPPQLTRDMTARRYLLQYSIYVHALRRWLSRKRTMFDERGQLHGVFYLYMRGMQFADSQSGIYFRSLEQKAGAGEESQ